MTNREMSLAVALYGTVHVTLMWSGPTPPNCSLVGAGMTEKNTSQRLQKRENGREERGEEKGTLIATSCKVKPHPPDELSERDKSPACVCFVCVVGLLSPSSVTAKILIS